MGSCVARGYATEMLGDREDLVGRATTSVAGPGRDTRPNEFKWLPANQRHGTLPALWEVARKMGISEVRNRAWTRRHDDPRMPLLSQVPRVVYPATLADLITLCHARPRSERLHAAGSHWALSEAAISDHTFIELNDPEGAHEALDRTLHDVVPHLLHPDLVERMKNVEFRDYFGTLVHVEAGKRIYQLYAELAQEVRPDDTHTLGGWFASEHNVDHYLGSWAFETLGGAGGQTIVGALTTGTHGGDFDLPPICDSVVAIHLVVDGGRHYWIEPATQTFGSPLVDHDRLQEYYSSKDVSGPDGAPFAVIADDEIFNATLVSAGRFGVIYSVVLRAVPQYSLWERRRLHVWQDVRKQLTDRRGPLFHESASAVAKDGTSITDEQCRFLQVVVCLTPHLGFSRNLAGVTKRWKVVRTDLAPGGEAQRIGAMTPGRSGSNPTFSRAGRSHPYTPKDGEPLLAAEASMLDRACSNGSFMGGVLKETLDEIEEFVSSNGATAGAGIAAVATTGAGGLLALIPALLLVAVILRELIDAFEPDDRLGEHLERLKGELLDPTELDPVKRAAGLFAWQIIAYKIFEQMQGDLEFGALSYAVMDRKNYLDRSCEHNVDSVEVFFDATDGRAVAFIDALIAFEVEQELHGRAFLGYASMRFVGPTRALLGMQHFNSRTTCAIEIAGLKDMSGTQELIEYAERLALHPAIGGILHWGQRNNANREQIAHVFGPNTSDPIGRLERWRRVLRHFTNDGTLDGFSNQFSRRAGLEP